MRMVLVLTAALAAATPAFAQSERNASDASAATSVAVGAIGESGLKASAGVVAIPLAVAGAAGVSGAFAVAGAGSAAVSLAADSADFSNKPLTISNDVVIAPPAQPAPVVPFTPEAKPQ
jgi:uncharacterized membrane protein